MVTGLTIQNVVNQKLITNTQDGLERITQNVINSNIWNEKFQKIQQK